MDGLEISTKTTGFGSPARAYTSKRLDPNDLIIEDPLTTFFFQWEGDERHGLRKGEYLVVDRAKEPEPEDIVVHENEGRLTASVFSEIDPSTLWGTITWKICKARG